MRLIAVWYKITIPPENGFFFCKVVYIVIFNLKFEIEFEKVSESFSKCIRIHKSLYITIVQYFTASILESLKSLRFSPQRDCQDSRSTVYHITSRCIGKGKGQRVQFRLSCSNFNKLANYRVYDFFFDLCFSGAKIGSKEFVK